jgi:hypothetical protein
MWWRKPVRPPPSYDDVCSVAEVLSRINADLIERHFAVSADEARQFLQRLVQECHFDQITPDGWHYPLMRRQRLRRLRAARKPAMVEEVIANQPATTDDLSKRIDELERERRARRYWIKRLPNAGKTVIRQREEWMSRAIEVEDALVAERCKPMNGDNRFDTLRRVIAKELQPDFCTGGDLEKTVRSECFKRLWPEIEGIGEW